MNALLLFVFTFLASSSGFLTYKFSGFSAETSASSRIERIKTLGEFIEALKVSGRKIVEKIIPDRQSHYIDLIQLPNALDIVVAQYDIWMHSAACGGVRMRPRFPLSLTRSLFRENGETPKP